MKKSDVLLGVLLFGGAVGCGVGDDKAALEEPHASGGSPKAVSVTSENGVTIEVRTCPESALKIRHGEPCAVSEGYVLIGGGATLSETDPDKGAFLKGSFPNGNSWHAYSFGTPDDAHRITVYAVGLKLAGLSAAALQRHVNTYTVTSRKDNHPRDEATLPSDYQLLSGGALVHDWGQYLTASKPSDDQRWYGEAKDHLTPFLGVIAVYAIGIKRGVIEGFGEIETQTVAAGADAAAGTLGNAAVGAPSGWLLGGVGGHANWGPAGQGRMLVGLYPASPIVAAAFDRDHLVGDDGRIVAYMRALRKKP